jgi:hypothetical protein
VNLTNAMWHLALAAFLVIVFPKPRSFAACAADVVLLLLSGLSGPLVLFLVPIAWWQSWRDRSMPQSRLGILYAALLTLCALVQLYFITSGAGGGRQSLLGATVLLFVHILANQVILSAILGKAWVSSLIKLPWWTGSWWAAAPVLLAVAATLWAFCKGPALYRQFLVLALLSLAAALKSPMISLTQPQWGPIQYPGIGGRYFFLPQLAWFATLLVLASLRPLWLRWAARLLMLCCVIGLAADWKILPYPPSPFATQATSFEKMPIGTSMTFDENPPGWQFTLTKH